ncbi:hypothetical protein M0812_26473 [Anaeramoeba flamelloides]|uniref:Uncharacterized protein n=1 Tax=Anaeramoeba flamelloides TaxID=1746091 RepID=A0AAV7YG41_9EUKA|nr:hypothetical protein M0812_26473 [Anaeramoeba flamelloides]
MGNFKSLTNWWSEAIHEINRRNTNKLNFSNHDLENIQLPLITYTSTTNRKRKTKIHNNELIFDPKKSNSIHKENTYQKFQVEKELANLCKQLSDFVVTTNNTKLESKEITISMTNNINEKKQQNSSLHENDFTIVEIEN